ncbi:exodeoxyribonuclease VII small subunit [Galbitalea sp. SE-J8]|uniref:exodeoxyribonuclease VII small subunit n=1 Tax=Galbitalea sp. SE-J8 TaxID=3054952 RepID=UPI00259D0D17|nr:exodeoxyribonuclease VII small subunit [Galbitalea sp. SE-J8]MDM4763387.1 exodeoxyribonuclease VII small subunit [Galbitalea sp. SE-J8]
MASDPTPLAELSYEQARDELVRVVQELEQGAPTLEQSLALWERGESLARRCEEWLLGARQRLEAARGAAADQHSAARGAAAERHSAARGAAAAPAADPSDDEAF